MTAHMWASRALTIQFIILVHSSRLYSHDEDITRALLAVEAEMKELKEEVNELSGEMKKTDEIQSHVNHLMQRVDDMEGLVSPVEALAEQLKDMYAEEHNFWEEYSLDRLCNTSRCDRRPRLRAALSNPCLRPGCEDVEGVMKGSCAKEKLAFVKWGIALCIHLHPGAMQASKCVQGAINLLNSTNVTKNTNVDAQEWASAPRGKESVIFWCRVDFKFHIALKRIPRRFLLSSTLLGAAAQMPGVNDFASCTWDCQKGLWAANSKGLVEEMHSGKRVYFLTAMNILHTFKAPFSQTVAFRVELPALAAAISTIRFGDFYLASLHKEMPCEDLALAVRLGLQNGAPQPHDERIRLRCINCAYCMQGDDPNCISNCIEGGSVFKKTAMHLLANRQRAIRAVYVNLTTFQELANAGFQHQKD